MKKIFLLLSLIVYLLFVLPYSITMAYEEASYDIVHKTNTYEVRHYPDRLVVQIVNKGDNNSFRKLFNYIAGGNKNSEKIEMTTPVTQAIEDDELFMQFYLPSKYNKENAPIPNNSDIEIATIEAGHFAVIEYSGRASDKNFEKHRNILRQKLLEDNISIIGNAIKATYNGPFTLPSFRRNEAMFIVDWKK